MSNICQVALAFNPGGFILPAEGSGVKEGEGQAQNAHEGKRICTCRILRFDEGCEIFFEQSGEDVLGRGGDQRIDLSINRS